MDILTGTPADHRTALDRATYHEERRKHREYLQIRLCALGKSYSEYYVGIELTDAFHNRQFDRAEIAFPGWQYTNDYTFEETEAVTNYARLCTARFLRRFGLPDQTAVYNDLKERHNARVLARQAEQAEQGKTRTTRKTTRKTRSK